MFCFICLDFDKDGFIDLATFKTMMDKAFNKRLREDNIGKIYKSVAGDFNKKVNLEKFVQLASVM